MGLKTNFKLELAVEKGKCAVFGDCQKEATRGEADIVDSTLVVTDCVQDLPGSD